VGVSISGPPNIGFGETLRRRRLPPYVTKIE